MNKAILLFLGAGLLCTSTLAAPETGKRVQNLDPALMDRFIGRWTNPVDHVIKEISSIDLVSGETRGKVQPTTGPAAADEHDLIGWVSAAPLQKVPWDNVTPVTFRTRLP